MINFKMSSFDKEKSQRLDEEIISTLSSLLENQKSIKQREEKEEFLLKEAKSFTIFSCASMRNVEFVFHN